MFKLHYWVQNGGDGSAIVKFEKSHKEAEKKDSKQDEGWGESSASDVELDIQDGKIVRKEEVWNGKQWNTVWIPLEEVKKPKK